MKQRIFDRKAFDEYQENEKRKTIFLFKMFVMFLIITNAVFVFFIISYKIQISQTKTNNINISNEIASYKDTNNQKESQNYKMLVNLFAVINTRFNSLTDILHSKEEFNKVMAYANMKDKLYSYICYQGSIDGDSYEGYHSFCGLFPDQIILIELTDGTRIGAYVSNA
jgi:cell division protein FtsB